LVDNFNRIFIGFLIIFFFSIIYFFKLDNYFLLIISASICYDLYNSNFLNRISSFIFFLFLSLFIFFASFLNEYQFIFISLFILSSILSLFFKNYLKFLLVISIFLFFLIFMNINFMNRDLFYLLIFVSFINDTLAFVSGSILKGPKITPNISPNKTWSGTLFSFLITFLILLNLKFGIIYSILISISFFLGDIYFSYIKRIYGIKDFSNILKSHGGILDRLDSNFFSFILLNFFLIYA